MTLHGSDRLARAQNIITVSVVVVIILSGGQHIAALAGDRDIDKASLTQDALG